MAVVKEIVCSRSVRVNTGQYEGTELFVSMKAELDELDDIETEETDLARTVERAMLRQLIANYRVRGKNLTPALIAKQHGLGLVGES